MKIVEDIGNYDVMVEFQDKYHCLVSANYANFKKGSVRNPYTPTLFGVGFVGQGPYKTVIGDKTDPIYNVWGAMLQRCYSEKSKDKYPSYYGICTVCDEWKNFQTFAKWYNENKYPCTGRLHIDKDILKKGNTIYSPQTCILIPQRFNMLFMNKTNKNGFPHGIRFLSTGQYVASYNGKHIGRFDTLEDAIVAHDTEKRNCIKKLVEEYKNELPLHIQQILLSW